MAKKHNKEASIKKESKFRISDLHTHVSMLLNKFREGKRTQKTKFYGKRGR